MLPDIMFLYLNVLANGHAFGASAFHVLRMCSGIRRLVLTLHTPTEVRKAIICLSNIHLYLLAHHGLIC